jgi:hypothetical protein
MAYISVIKLVIHSDATQVADSIARGSTNPELSDIPACDQPLTLVGDFDRSKDEILKYVIEDL